MTGFRVLIGSETTSPPAELTQIVEQNESLRMVGFVTDWTILLAAVEGERPDILLLDRALWRAASGRRLQRISLSDPAPRIVMFSEGMYVSIVGEVIAYGVQGCMSDKASFSQWNNDAGGDTRRYRDAAHDIGAGPGKILAPSRG